MYIEWKWQDYIFDLKILWGYPHCKPNPVMKTGNPILIAGIPVMKTGFFLWEKLHRENPVFITGMGLQCDTIFSKEKTGYKTWSPTMQR